MDHEKYLASIEPHRHAMTEALRIVNEGYRKRDESNRVIERELSDCVREVRKRAKNLMRKKGGNGYQHMVYVSAGNWVTHGQKPVAIIPHLCLRFCCGSCTIEYQPRIDKHLDRAIEQFVQSAVSLVEYLKNCK